MLTMKSITILCTGISQAGGFCFDHKCKIKPRHQSQHTYVSRYYVKHRTQSSRLVSNAPFSANAHNKVRTTCVCVPVCMCVSLTRPAGDARLNSARTLASPNAFNSTHMTGKSKGNMGRTPINCKFNVIRSINSI